MRAEGLLHTAGHAFLEACDHFAQDRISEAEAINQLSLDGRDGKPDRSDLVKRVVKVISEDTPNETLQRENELQQKIHICTRNELESLASFANRFSGAITRYAIKTEEPNSRIGG